MDDANWISSTLDDLEDILKVADDFYMLTRAAINKDKSKLLTNTTAAKDPIPIRFGNTTVPINPCFGAVRFLGVKINIRLNHSLVKQELRAHIRSFVNLIKSKTITDRQFCYVVNHVLFPQLLYKMRLTPLSRSACLSLNQAIRSLFKHKNQFPRTTPNAIFHDRLFYDLNDVWTEQIAEISTALLNQFNSNSPLLLNISRIRLFHLQQQELASTTPLNHWMPLNDYQHYRYNNIAAQLYLLKHAKLGLTFRCADNLINQIIGGSKVIKDYLPPQYIRKYRSKLIKYNLIFQKQVIFMDGSSFCIWNQFRKRPFASHLSTQASPKFFSELQRIFTTNDMPNHPNLIDYDHDT